jgi:hypothetical protein
MPFFTEFETYKRNDAVISKDYDQLGPHVLG